MAETFYRGDPDRLSLATHNLLRTDWSGVRESLFSPATTSPAQRGYTPDSGGWLPAGDDPYSKVLRVAGNPLVILGAVFAMRYPVPTAKALMKWGGKIRNYSERLWPGVWRLQHAESLFRGTPFWKIVKKITHEAHRFQSRVAMDWAEGLLKYEARTGRSPGFQTQVASSVMLDGLHVADNRSWKYLRGWLRRELYREKYAGHAKLSELIKNRTDDTIERFVERVGVVDRPDKLRALVDDDVVGGARKAMEWAWSEMFKGRNLERMLTRGEAAYRSRLVRKYGSDMMKVEEKLKRWRIRKTSGENVLKFLEEQGVTFKIPDKVRKDPQRLARFMQSVQKSAESGEFKYIEKYFPHVTTSTPRETEEFMRAIFEATPAARRAALKKGMTPLTSRLKARRWNAIPNLRDIEMLGDTFSAETVQARELIERLARKNLNEKIAKGALEVGDDLSEVIPRQYSLRLSAVMEHYGHNMAKTYAWTARGMGERLKAELAVVDRMDKQGYKRRVAREHILPVIMGRLNENEAMHALAWGDRKVQAWEFLNKPSVREWFKKAGAEDIPDRLQKMLETPTIQNLTWKNAGAKLAAAMYLSTLGLNPASAGLNVMQNLLTTSSVVEGKYLLQGLQRVMGGAEKFAAELARTGRVEESFAKAFPQYIKYIADPQEVEAMAAFRRAMVGGGSWRAKGERAKAVLMSMFTATERFNKLWAFEAGRAKALGEGLRKGADIIVGQRVMEMTQFPGGPLGTPVGMMNWWAPFRQFTQFPLRTMELLLRNPSTLSRAALYGGVIYGAGKEFADVDLSRGLIFGAAPVPDNPEAPFYPLPIVPPLLQMGGAVAASLAEGDSTQFRRALPLLVPGGVALARASSVVAPGLAERLGREYADYGNVQPDGRIPVMSSQGTLKGFYSPVQLFGRAVGFGTLTGDKEAELMKYLVGQRDKIRAFRRQYVEALVKNDQTEAYRVKEQYHKAYPQLGELTVKDSDIRAVEARHMVTRLERLLDTVPQEARPMFGEMITTALGEGAEQFTGVDPGLLSGGGTMAQRRAGRNVQAHPGLANVRGEPEQRNVLGVRDRPILGNERLRGDQTGRQPSDAFGSFDLGGF